MAFTILHQQVKSKVFNEVVTVVSQALTVKCVKKTVSGSVSYTATSVSLSSLAVLVTLASKCSLVDLTLWSSAEGHSIVLQLNDGSWSLSGHVMDGILISQPIRSPL